VGEEVVDLVLAHGLRMGKVVEVDEAADPRDVALLGSEGVVAGANLAAHPVEQADGFLLGLAHAENERGGLWV